MKVWRLTILCFEFTRNRDFLQYLWSQSTEGKKKKKRWIGLEKTNIRFSKTSG